MRHRAVVILLLVTLAAAVTAACAGQRQHRSLPDGLNAAVAWNENGDQWHLGVWLAGDRLGSNLTLLCITDPKRTPEFGSAERTGFSIHVSLSREDGEYAFDGRWQIEGQGWDGADWERDSSWSPPRYEAPTPEDRDAFYRALRGAEIAQFTNFDRDDPLHSTSFDVASLFATDLNLAFDDCDTETIDQLDWPRGSIYIYWVDNGEGWQSHWYVATSFSIDEQWLATLVCAPPEFYDEPPNWLVEEAENTPIPLVALRRLGESIAGETVMVTWGSTVVGRHSTNWEVGEYEISPTSELDTLKYYDALRRSDPLEISIQEENGALYDVQVPGTVLTELPLSREFDGCVREYADQYGH